MSVHPTITDHEVEYICNSLKALSKNIMQWSKDYKYDAIKNDYVHKSWIPTEKSLVAKWFNS